MTAQADRGYKVLEGRIGPLEIPFLAYQPRRIFHDCMPYRHTHRPSWLTAALWCHGDASPLRQSGLQMAFSGANLVSGTGSALLWDGAVPAGRRARTDLGDAKIAASGANNSPRTSPDPVE